MLIEYGVLDTDYEYTPCGSYAEAAEAAAPTDQIWMTVDAWPVVEGLPDTYDRVTVLESGQILMTAVLQRHEIEPQWGANGFGGNAPLLTINKQNQTVQFRTDSGDDVCRWPQ